MDVFGDPCLTHHMRTRLMAALDMSDLEECRLVSGNWKRGIDTIIETNSTLRHHLERRGAVAKWRLADDEEDFHQVLIVAVGDEDGEGQPKDEGFRSLHPRVCVEDAFFVFERPANSKVARRLRIIRKNQHIGTIKLEHKCRVPITVKCTGDLIVVYFRMALPHRSIFGHLLVERGRPELEDFFARYPHVDAGTTDPRSLEPEYLEVACLMVAEAYSKRDLSMHSALSTSEAFSNILASRASADGKTMFHLCARIEKSRQWRCGFVLYQVRQSGVETIATTVPRENFMCCPGDSIGSHVPITCRYTLSVSSSWAVWYCRNSMAAEFSVSLLAGQNPPVVVTVNCSPQRSFIFQEAVWRLGQTGGHLMLSGPEKEMLLRVQSVNASVSRHYLACATIRTSRSHVVIIVEPGTFVKKHLLHFDGNRFRAVILGCPRRGWRTTVGNAFIVDDHILVVQLSFRNNGDPQLVKTFDLRADDLEDSEKIFYLGVSQFPVTVSPLGLLLYDRGYVRPGEAWHCALALWTTRESFLDAARSRLLLRGDKCAGGEIHFGERKLAQRDGLALFRQMARHMQCYSCQANDCSHLALDHRDLNFFGRHYFDQCPRCNCGGLRYFQASGIRLKPIMIQERDLV